MKHGKRETVGAVRPRTVITSDNLLTLIEHSELPVEPCKVRQYVITSGAEGYRAPQWRPRGRIIGLHGFDDPDAWPDVELRGAICGICLQITLKVLEEMIENLRGQVLGLWDATLL